MSECEQTALDRRLQWCLAFIGSAAVLVVGGDLFEPFFRV
jgi:hypothetical protein